MVYRDTIINFGVSLCSGGGMGSREARNHPKHAQSTYLDEYLQLQKNLMEKILLGKVLEQNPQKYTKIVESVGILWKTV